MKRNRNKQNPFVLNPFLIILAVCCLCVGYTVSGPKDKAEKESVIAEEIEFPDIRTRGQKTEEVIVVEDPSKLDKVEALPPTNTAPDFKHFPAPKEIERIPMPEPGFGIAGGGSSNPAKKEKWIPVEPEATQKPAPATGAYTYPEAPRRVETKKRRPFTDTAHGNESPQFKCDLPILETLGQIAVSEVERYSGVAISFEQDTEIGFKLDVPGSVALDIKVPSCETHPGHNHHKKKQDTTSAAVGFAFDILDQILSR